MDLDPDREISTEVEDLFYDFLELAESDDCADFDAFCARHPRHEGVLRDLHQNWLVVRRGLRPAARAPSNERKVEKPNTDTWELFLGQLRSRGPYWRRYRSRGEIARGGMGSIVRVFDEDLRRHLAMKVVLPRDSRSLARSTPVDSRTLGRFLEEAQVTAQLDHPGIVPVHDLGVDDEGRVFFTMKLVKGRDLRDVFEQVKSGSDGWNQTRALSVLLRACDALTFAHEKGVIHRDLKPANIMVGRHGETYVMDWGLARILGEVDNKDIRLQESSRTMSVVQSDRRELDEPLDEPLLTMNGDVVGTPAYMAPEQADGRVEDMGPHSDVYSIGAILYELCTSRMPFTEPSRRVTARGILRAVQAGPPEPIHDIDPSVPAELVAIAEKAMAREPKRRYATAEALADDLRAYLEDRVVKAYRTGALAELTKWVARNRRVAAGLIGAVLLLVAALVVIAKLFVLAEHRTARLLELAEVDRVGTVHERLEELWPAHPGQVEDLQALARDMEEVIAGRDRHLASMLALRRDAEPAADASEPPRFRDTETQWWHDTLQQHIEAIDDFADEEDPSITGHTLVALQRRIEFAQQVRRRSIVEHQAAWTHAIETIADRARCPQYDGLRICEQMGLVPIDRDPETGLFEFWHIQTGERPERRPDGRLQITESTGLVFVLIPAGTYWQGAQRTDPDGRRYYDQAAPDECPPSRIRLDPFFLSKYEMTQGQWLRFTGANPSAFHPGFTGTEIRIDHPLTLTHPVEQINWWLSRDVLRKLGLVLPTEAQWEYACRAGTDSEWWTGDDRESLRDTVNLADQSAKAAGATFSYISDWPNLDDGYPTHAPVDTFRPNPFGLYNVHGNVSEWCLDGYPEYAVPVRDGDGLRVIHDPAVDSRVFRGGSFYFSATYARSARRFEISSRFLYFFSGVRPARVIDRDA